MQQSNRPTWRGTRLRGCKTNATPAAFLVPKPSGNRCSAQQQIGAFLTSSAQCVAVDPPSSPDPPFVVISAPGTVGNCDDLALEGSATSVSTGRCGHTSAATDRRKMTPPVENLDCALRRDSASSSHTWYGFPLSGFFIPYLVRLSPLWNSGFSSHTWYGYPLFGTPAYRHRQRDVGGGPGRKRAIGGHRQHIESVSRGGDIGRHWS